MTAADGSRRAMRGLSEAAFRERFGTEAACRKALFRRLLSGFGVVSVTYATRLATRVPSSAFPRRRALCTTWKKPR
jgi:hypothetical protein